MVNAEKRRRTSATSSRSTARPGGEAVDPVHPGVAARLRYRFDLALARGPIVVIGYLGLVMLAIIAVSSVVIWLLGLKGVNGGDRIDSPFDAFWQSLLRVIDSGNFASDATWPTRIMGLLMTLAGIFLAGSLIGLIASAVDQQIMQLRKGRSRVLERGHTLVLGWSPRLPTILRELVDANENHRKAAVVILASAAKDEMEDDLRAKVPERKTTRVVCRTGDPSSPVDLQMVNLAGARSVVVLAGHEGDAGVAKAVLAVRGIDPEFATAHVVAELRDPGHAMILRTLATGRIVTVQADEIIAELTAQACHQAGLATVFQQLLSFEGDEIYFTPAPELDGARYADVLLAYEESSVLGWVDPGGGVVLNPPLDSTFQPGSELITVSADDDAVRFTGFVPSPELTVDPCSVAAEAPHRVLMIGWSVLGPGVLRELDQFLPPGSVIDLIADTSLIEGDGDVLRPALGTTERCRVDVHPGGRGPEALLAMASAGYDEAIVLGYRGRVPVAEADARTMLTLLVLEKAFASSPVRPRVVAEMLDRSNVAVARTTGAADFIASDELSSLLIAQLSERLELHQVFDELFAADGAFLSLRTASLYGVASGQSYREVVGAAAARGETALGYRLDATGRVVVNPPKASAVSLGARDQVLVLGPRTAASSG